MRRVGTLTAMLILLLLSMAAFVTDRTAGGGASSTSAAEVGGKEWIDFTLQDANGKDVSLSRFIGKKPVLLAFWATWCPHCNEAVPLLNRIHTESLPGGGIQTLALDFMESREKVNAFVLSRKVLFPVLLDGSGSVAREYRVVGIPTYILIDRDGRVAYREHDFPDIRRYLR